MKSRKKRDEVCVLSELLIGDKAKIVEVKSDDSIIRKRLFEMGVTCGVVVEVKKVAPLGDPVSIFIRGYELCLRKSELKNVVAKVI